MAISNPYSQLWPEPEPGDFLPPDRPELESGDQVRTYVVGRPVTGRIKYVTPNFGLILITPDDPPWEIVTAYDYEVELLEKAPSKAKRRTSARLARHYLKRYREMAKQVPPGTPRHKVVDYANMFHKYLYHKHIAEGKPQPLRIVF